MKTFIKYLALITCITLIILLYISCTQTEPLKEAAEEITPTKTVIENKSTEDTPPPKDSENHTSKDITQLLEETLSDAELADLTSIISLTCDDLWLGDTDSMLLTETQHAKWVVSIAPLFELSKETANFVDDINNGFTLAKERIDEKDYKKIEQALTIFDELAQQLPPIVPTVRLILRDIETDFLKDCTKTTIDEAESTLGFNLTIPAYLPEKFAIYGVYLSNNCQTVRQLHSWDSHNCFLSIAVIPLF